VLAFADCRRTKETVGTLGSMLFFAGAILEISGSLFVTQGGVSPTTYFRVGTIELVRSLLFLIGMGMIVEIQ